MFYLNPSPQSWSNLFSDKPLRISHTVAPSIFAPAMNSLPALGLKVSPRQLRLVCTRSAELTNPGLAGGKPYTQGR